MKTYFAVTVWMVCVIPHIFKDSGDNFDVDHRKQVNNITKTLYGVLSEDEFAYCSIIFLKRVF